MSNVLNNPIMHGVVTVVVMALGWFITSGNPVLTVTIGGVLKGLYTWLVAYAK